MSEPSPAEIHAHMRVLANGILERDATIKQLLAQLPSDGQGRWRQGTKNPRNLYVHQGDDEVGQPVGQLYSAELAALVCDAVNAQQTRAMDDETPHAGGNAEDCPACSGRRDLIYPFLCPGVPPDLATEASDETTSGLRERIISDVENRCSHPGDGPLTPDGEHCASCWELSRDLWASVWTELDRRDAEIKRLREEFEDRVDTAIAKRVLEQGGENVPLDQVLRENGLCGCADADRTYADMEAHYVGKIETLREALSEQADRHQRLEELAADHVAEYAQEADEADAWSKRLYAAWWSARIGRARTRKTLDIVAAGDLKHQFQRDQLKAALDRVQALAEDMRTWCSPHGIAVTYAQRIEEAINPPELAVVREFAAKLDPRGETT